MKKLIMTIAFYVFCVLALSTYAFADVAVAPMLITIGLIYLLIAAVIIIAVALIIKLVIRIVRSRNK